MISPLTFLLETRDELTKVTWPTQDEVIRLTLVVISVSLLIGIYIGGLDFILTKLTSMIIK